MSAPVDGRLGRIWRALTYPARIVSPLVLLARRALPSNRWEERIEQRIGPRPALHLGDRNDIQRPEDGTGPLNHRTYTVRIAAAELEPREVIEAFRRDPNRFSPTSYATFVPSPEPPGLAVGQTYEIKLPGPWDGPVSVRSADSERIRLETLSGHMEAGWIEFGCQKRGEVLEFTIESFARSGDPVFDTLYHRLQIAKYVQSEMWAQVLESAVRESGGRQQGRLRFETILYQEESA